MSAQILERPDLRTKGPRVAPPGQPSSMVRPQITTPQLRESPRRIGRSSQPESKQEVQALARAKLPLTQRAGHRVQTSPLTHAGQVAQMRPKDETGFTFSLPMLFILSGYLVGAALVLICGLDLMFAVPFSRVNLVFDIGFLFCGATLVYLSWDARDGCRYA